MPKIVSRVLATLREWSPTSKGHVGIAEQEEDSDENGGETGHHLAKERKGGLKGLNVEGVTKG